MATFSFSTTGNFWKTKYSFEPHCYGSVDNYLLSFNQVQSSDKICWLHNTNNTRNSFYGQTYPSRITVVSNQDPSMEKVYKTVSIESNQNTFTAAVSTNLDLSESSVTKRQSSNIKSFEPREEALYTDIGPSLTNNTKNFKVVARLQAYLPLTSSQLQQFKFIETIKPGYKYIAFAAQIIGDSRYSSDESKYKVAFSTLTYNQPPTPAIYSDPKYIKIENNVAVEKPFTVENCYDESVYHIAGVRSQISSTYPGTYIVFGFEQIYNDYLLIGSNVFRGLYLGNVVYQVSDPEMDGDPLRGKYAMIVVDSNADGKPFELYAINTEYSHSKLDASS